MNSVSPYYVNFTLFYSYFVCYCLQWVDTSSIQQFLDLTSPDFLSYPLNLTLALHCNFVLRMEIRWWQTKLDVKTIIFKHLWAIDLHDQRPSTSSACIKPLTGHVTIYGSLSGSNIQQVRFVCFGPGETYNFIGKLKSRHLAIFMEGKNFITYKSLVWFETRSQSPTWSLDNLRIINNVVIAKFDCPYKYCKFSSFSTISFSFSLLL